MRCEDARLHPVSVLIGVPLVQLLRGLVLPAFAVLAGGRRADLTPVLLLGFVLVGLGVRVLAWQRFRWSFDGETVRVEQGVLSRTRRVVGVARVQQVELDRPLVQRLLGVATVRIDTAGTDAAPEVELRVLTLADALALRTALQPHVAPPDGTDVEADGRTVPDAAGPSPTVVLRLTLTRVALAAVTGVQLLVAPAALLGLAQLAGERGEAFVEDVLRRALAAGTVARVPDARLWLAGLLIGLLLSVVTAVVLAVVRDGRFVVLRVGDDLVLRRGLLGTRESIVPLRRVQVVRVVANPVRRAFGLATVRIHSAGGAGGSASGDGRRVAIPIVRGQDVAALLAQVLPDLGPDGLPPLRPHPLAALRRILWRRFLLLLDVVGPFVVAWAVLAGLPTATRDGLPLPDLLRTLLGGAVMRWTVPLAVVVVLTVAQAVLGVVEHRTLGHGLDTHHVVARTGTLARTLSIAPLARLQGVTRRVSWFQERRGLATVRAHVAGPGGDVEVRDADGADADRLRKALADAASQGVTSRPAPSPDRR